MKLLLSKYYLLTKAVLPDSIEPKTIENLAIEDVPNIFMALPIKPDSLTKEQVEVIKKAREQLVQKHDYQSNWMATWQAGFEAKHDALNTLLSGFGWVTVLQDQVVVRAQGDIWAWRVRTGEPPIAFKNYDGVEATLPNDVWLLTWAKESVQPNEGDLAAEVALNYAEKLYEDQTDKSRFDLLKIERVIDTEVPTTIPTENHAVGRRVLAIAKRMIAAEHPFTTYEPLLKSLSHHKQFGNEANDLFKKHSSPPPTIESPESGPKLPEKPLVAPQHPINPSKKPNLYIIGGAIVLGVLSAFKVHQMLNAPPKAEIAKIPTLKPPAEQTPTTIPPTTTPTQPTPKPPVNPSPTLPPVPSVSLKNVNDLMERAEKNIEQCPKWIQDAFMALDAAKKTGLDKTAYAAKVTEIVILKQKLVGKLQEEAKELSNTAENTGKEGKAPKAVRELQAAKAKLELEKQLDDSKKVQERLQKVNERIEHWKNVY